jgi:hypothetical protein
MKINTLISLRFLTAILTFYEGGYEDGYEDGYEGG